MRVEREVETGFTLVEVIIALAVISIALLSAMGLIMSSATLKQTTREFSLAQELAAGEIERLKAYPAAGRFDELASLDGTSSPLSQLQAGTLRRQVDASNPHLFRVTVTVTWVSSAMARTHSEEVIVSR
jgi:prepilin-type N-terminal cleavage/methylation domain-containing protein